MAEHRPRRPALRTRILAALAVTLVASSVSSAPPAAAAPPSGATAAPWVGLLGATPAQSTFLARSGVTRVMVQAGWNTFEPRKGVFNLAAMRAFRQRVVAMTQRGYDVVLDLGLQYPPAWVFDLPGPTRFVNQYGDAWHGVLSTDVANAVFNPAVRNAQASYLKRLAMVLQPLPIADIRIGGLLTGELRYPPANYNGHTNSLWSYDVNAQASSPVPGWRPGQGDASDARQALDHYFSSLTGYLTWLMTTVATRFPTAGQQVLFPSWGLRPGMVDTAIAGGMTGRTNAEVNGMIASGLDWTDQVRAVAATGIDATVYGTWIDAPPQGSSDTAIAPIEYLARLAAAYGLPTAGENTGGGGAPALQRSLDYVRSLHLTGMMYMSGRMFDQDKAGMSLSDFKAAATAFTH